MVVISGASCHPGEAWESSQSHSRLVLWPCVLTPRGVLPPTSNSWLLAWFSALAVCLTNECCQFQGKQGRAEQRAWHNPSPLQKQVKTYVFPIAHPQAAAWGTGSIACPENDSPLSYKHSRRCLQSSSWEAWCVSTVPSWSVNYFQAASIDCQPRDFPYCPNIDSE